MLNKLLYQNVAFTVYGKTEKSYNTFKVSALTWNEELELPNK